MKYNIEFRYVDRITYGDESIYKSYRREFGIDSVSITKDTFNETELDLLRTEKSFMINETLYLIRDIKLRFTSEQNSVVMYVEHPKDNSDDLPF